MATRARWNVHLYPSTLEHESRMDRICSAIDELGVFDVICQVGVARDDLAETESAGGHVQRRRVRGGQRSARSVAGKALAALSWTGRVFSELRREHVVVVNSHSLATLPLGVALKWWHGARLIYDTHELETATVTSHGVRRVLLQLLERILIRIPDRVSVVSASIADWYASTYGIDRPIVVRNVPIRRARPTSARSSMLRERLAIPEGDLVFLYQGVLGPGRNVRTFLDAFKPSPSGRHLVLLGFGPWESEIREEAARNPAVHHLDAVPHAELLAYTAGADVGLVGMENLSLSQYFSLPNKFFEFLAAGVPVLVPDYPEMRSIVDQQRCGWVLREGATWAGRIATLSATEIAEARPHAVQVGEVNVWENERAVLRQLYEGLGLVDTESAGQRREQA
jgi:glycosyltransferase involved in cell wall biosynthesis